MTTVADEVGFLVASPHLDNHDSTVASLRVIDRLRTTAGRTEPWYRAILRAISEWTLASEDVAHRRWHYVIAGEALDWITLAHRLTTEIPDAIPPAELDALLFRGRLPRDIDPEQFRSSIGRYRYTAHLNFWYGVTVEEALQLAVEDTIRKNRRALCYQDNETVVQEAYRHLYGATQSELADQFLSVSSGQWGNDLNELSLTAYQEFTYWLFKKRVHKWHPARVASDTRRGLEKLRVLQSGAEPDQRENPVASGYVIQGSLPPG